MAPVVHEQFSSAARPQQCARKSGSTNLLQAVRVECDSGEFELIYALGVPSIEE